MSYNEIFSIAVYCFNTLTLKVQKQRKKLEILDLLTAANLQRKTVLIPFFFYYVTGPAASASVCYSNYRNLNIFVTDRNSVEKIIQQYSVIMETFHLN